MYKIYGQKNCIAKVHFDDGLIRVYSNQGLWCYLNANIKLNTLKLVYAIKKDYRKVYNKTLKISDNSLMVEIWAHVYSDYFGQVIERHLRIKWMQKLLKKGIERAAVIDCGEKHLDTNRWLWDLLSPFKAIIVLFLPKIPVKH